MVLTLAIIILCVIVLYIGLKLVNAVEQRPDLKAGPTHEVLSPEVLVRLSAIHRVLLDGLKPHWWATLMDMMQEFEGAQNQEENTSDLLALRLVRIKREDAFIELICKMPLHAVDSHLWTLAQQAQKDHSTARSIRSLIAQNSFTDDDRRLAAYLLRDWEKVMERHNGGAHDGADGENLMNLGQPDLIRWFDVNIRSLREECYFWRSKLKEIS